MKKITLFLIVVAYSFSASSQDYNYQFRLRLKDKGNTAYSTDRPEEYLSAKAIERRQKQNIPVGKTDLPISDEYLNMIKDSGGRIVAKSKWLGTVTVSCTDSSLINDLTALPFVHDAALVWKGIARKQQITPDTIKDRAMNAKAEADNIYGRAWNNIKTHKGQAMHNAGFRGQGMDIAVIDAGFRYLPRIEALQNVKIKGTKPFVDGITDIFDRSMNTHGLMVLSCMAGNVPNKYIGTAPEASFWLFTTEDSRSEFPVEEDYWVTAIEYADSVGVDVVNTSLGYAEFDIASLSRKHKDLDGKTAFISRGANMAARKGMLIVCSAGNSGDTKWGRITSPADAEYILTVGAIESDSTIASFSSRGPAYDLRVKPDVMALGALAAVINDSGSIGYASGTSFSSPIMCGLAACLWQAFPSLSNREIIRVLCQSADRIEDPDKDYGYGIPDMEKAMSIAQTMLERKQAKLQTPQTGGI